MTPVNVLAALGVVLCGALLALLLWAGASGVLYAVRAALAARRGATMFPDIPNPDPSLELAASVALDELVVLPMGLLGSLFPKRDYQRASSELDEAVRFYEKNRWLDDPAGYFQTPPPPDDVRVGEARTRRGPVARIRFQSGWEPHPGEPGGDRWRSFRSNGEVIATMLRHEGSTPRPWLVGLHGQGMGRPSDVDFLHLRRVHRELGVNLLLPVLPLHGPRAEGLRSDRMFVSNVHPVNDVLGFSQAMWDVRRALAWLRVHEGATRVGVLGLSLGSLAAGLLSTLDPDLACVIAVVPSADLAGAIRDAEPLLPWKRDVHREVHDSRSTLAHGLVSPLAKPCLVPKERRFIIAGLGDRIASPPGATLLWRHWEEPDTWWRRRRGHLTTAMGSEFDERLAAILRTSGVAVET
jgi:hypothetical protein